MCAQRFEKRIAIVTGAAAGIGKAIALGLYAEGAIVIANDLSSERLEALTREVPVVPVVGGTDQPETAGKLVEAALDAGGRIDALFNNAGISKLGAAEEFLLDDWNRIIAVNLIACFAVTQAVGKQMIIQRHGTIVNIASTAGLIGMPRNSAYIASKHGVVGLTRALAVEWARYGIRVNAVCPGLTRTETIRELERTDPELITAREEGMLLGRLAKPEEQAAVALFLASDDASYVNGQVTTVDGGSHALYSGYPAPQYEGPG